MEPQDNPIEDDQIIVDPPQEPTDLSESLTAYYQLLKEHDIIQVPEDFEFDPTEESLNSLIKASKEEISKATLKATLSKVHPDLLDVVEYALSGGTSLEEFIPKPTSIESEQAQKDTIFNYYKATTSLSESKIRTLIEKIDDPEDLRKEAEEALASLTELQKEKKSKLKQQLEAQRQAEEESVQKTIEQLTSQIDQYDTDPKRKTKLKAFFLNEVSTPSGPTTEFSTVMASILSNPSHTVQLADILTDYDFKKGFNFSRFQKQGETSANKSLKDLLDKATKRPSGQTTPVKEEFDWEAFLNL